MLLTNDPVCMPQILPQDVGSVMVAEANKIRNTSILDMMKELINYAGAVELQYEVKNFDECAKQIFYNTSPANCLLSRGLSTYALYARPARLLVKNEPKPRFPERLNSKLWGEIEPGLTRSDEYLLHFSGAEEVGLFFEAWDVTSITWPSHHFLTHCQSIRLLGHF